MRAKQQAALDKRFAVVQQNKSTISTVTTAAPRQPSALEKMSKENVAWRAMDAQMKVQRWD